MSPKDQQASTDKWRNRAFAVWTIIGICVLAGIIIWICGIISQAVTTIVITALAVLLLHGSVERLESKGLPRIAATAIVVVIVTLIILAFMVAVVPVVVQQLSALVTNMPNYTSQLLAIISERADVFGPQGKAIIADFLNTVTDWVRQQGGTIISRLAGGVIGGLLGVGNGVLVAFISLICTFWILLDLPRIIVEMRKLFSDDFQDDLDIIFDAIGNAVYGWARATIVCAIIVGVVSGIAFWIIGVPYAALLGLACGLLYFIPYIGTIVTTIVAAVLALFVSPLACIATIVVCVIVHNVVSNIISPRLMQRSVSVHPALVLIGILVGGALGGVPGLLLSIPVIATIQGIFVTYFEARTGKELATENGALFLKKKQVDLPHLDDTGRIHMPGADKGDADK